MHFSTVGDFSSAASTFAFSGTILPRRQPPSAVMMSFALRVVVAVGDGFRGEAAEDDRMHRPDAGAGEHGDRRLRHHRHVDRDAVALRDAERFQGVGEPADFAVQLLVGQRAGVARLAFPDDRGLVLPPGGEVPVEAVVADVQLCRRRTTWRAARSTSRAPWSTA